MKRFLSLLLAVALLFAGIPLLTMADTPTSPYSQPHFGLMYRAHLYSNTPGFALSYMGLTTGAANNDTLYVGPYDWDGDTGYDDYTADQWEGFGKDGYLAGGQFVLQVIATGDSAAPQGERSRIVGWDSDAGMVIVSPVFSATVAQGEVVAFIHVSQLPNTGTKTISYSAVTGVDSTTILTAVGDVYLTSLFYEVTTVWASTADSVYFVYDAATATDIARMDKGEELNAAADGTVFALNSATFGTATLKILNIPTAHAGLRILIPDGTVIKIVSEGSAVTGAAEINATWEACDPYSYMR